MTAPQASPFSSLQCDDAAALKLCLPLAKADGAYRREARVQAEHALTPREKFADAGPLLRAATESECPRATASG